MIILTNITIVGVILTSEMRRSPNGYFKFHLGKPHIIVRSVLGHFTVISPEFGMGQHRDDNHQEDAPHFIFQNGLILYS